MIKLIKSSSGCKLVDHQEILKEFDSAEEGKEYIDKLKSSIIDEFMSTERRPIVAAKLKDGKELNNSFGPMKYVVPKHNEKPYIIINRKNGLTYKYFEISSIEY